METITKERLAELGFTKSAEGISKVELLQHAYENYTFISQDRVDAFNRKLKEDSKIEDARFISYKTLNFIPIAQYTDIPPAEALDKVAKAKNDFDTMEVCKIAWHKEVKDPIIFGRINGCPDRFFICQWDNDIKLSDFLLQ